MGPIGPSKLMDIPFNPLNINLLATKAMSLLFTPVEISEGYVEPSDAQDDYQPLDQERIDLIKSKILITLFNLITNLQNLPYLILNERNLY